MPENKITLDEAVKFIQGKHGIMKDWTESNLKAAIAQAIRDAAFGYTEFEGKLTGICFGYWKDKTCLHVMCIASDVPLKFFVDYLKRVFPSCTTLTARRKGRLVTFNVNKL